MIAAVSIGKRGPKDNLIGRLEIHLPSETKWHKNFLLEFGFETSCSVQWGGEGKKVLLHHTACMVATGLW